MAGACDIIPKAEYVVLGRTQYDQDFVDEAVVAGATCGHPAPKPRPPELDAAPALKAPPPAPAKRPGIVRRIKDKISRVRVPGFVSPAVAAPAPAPMPIPEEAPPPVIVAPDPPSPPPRPAPVVIRPARVPVDELLDPQ